MLVAGPGVPQQHGEGVSAPPGLGMWRCEASPQVPVSAAASSSASPLRGDLCSGRGPRRHRHRGQFLRNRAFPGARARQRLRSPPAPVPRAPRLCFGAGHWGPHTEPFLFAPDQVWGISWAEPSSPDTVLAGCWGGVLGWVPGGAGAPPPSPPCTPAHREGQRQGRSPGRCLSTFPARPSVRNGEALLGIRRWPWDAIPLPRQPRHPNTMHRVQAAPAAPGKVAGRMPAVG